MVLLFKPKHEAMILEKRKTQTRRTWAKSRCLEGSTHQARLKLFGEPFARLKILRVWRERLGSISDTDSRAEGYRNRWDFIRAWRSIYGEWDEDLEVWAVEFEVVVP